MSTNNTNWRWTYEPNGVSTSFTFDNLVLAAADLSVRWWDADGTELSLPAHSVSGVGNPLGGTVDFESAPATTAGSLLVIERKSGRLQSQTFKDFIQETASVRELRADRPMLAAQEMDGGFARAVMVHPLDADGPYVWPAPTERALKFSAWDSQGRHIAAAAVSADGTPMTPFAQAFLASMNAQAAREYLKIVDEYHVEDYYQVPEADHTSAWNAAVAAALPNCGKVVAGAALYTVSGPIVIDVSAITVDPINGGQHRLAIEGVSGGATRIEFSHSGKLFDYRGGTGDGLASFLIIKDLAVEGPARAAGSIGLALDNCAYFDISGLDISLCEYGVKATDALSGSFRSCEWRLNEYGWHFAYGDVSRPNAISMQDCVTATNYTYGGLITGGATFLYTGGTVEGNGIGKSLASTDAWGIKAVDMGVEGKAGLVTHGTYFEGNNGNADVWLVQTNYACHSHIHGSFNRYLSAQYVTYCVLFDKAGSGAGSTCTVGGGFGSAGTYTEHADRRYLGGGIAYFSEQPGTYFQSATALGRDVMTPSRHPVIPVAFLPTPATWTNGIVYCPDLGGGAGWLGADATRWKRLDEGGSETIVNDANSSLVTLVNAAKIIDGTTLTANRTRALSTTNAYKGACFRVTRVGGGAFNLDIGGLVNLATKDWADFEYDGAAWFLSAFGTNP